MSLHITDLKSIPSLGELVGVRGDRDLIDDINRMTGSSSYFGTERDRFRDNHREFITKIIEPIRMANSSVRTIATRLVNQDIIKPIETEEDLRNIPPCMMIPVLTHEPLFNMFKQGRISGWGFTADNLKEEKDRYDRLVDKNGHIELDTMCGEWDENGDILVTAEYDFNDPELTFEEAQFIKDAREFIDKIIDKTELDPTDLDALRG